MDKVGSTVFINNQNGWLESSTYICRLHGEPAYEWSGGPIKIGCPLPHPRPQRKRRLTTDSYEEIGLFASGNKIDEYFITVSPDQIITLDEPEPAKV